MAGMSSISVSKDGFEFRWVGGTDVEVALVLDVEWSPVDVLDGEGKPAIRYTPKWFVSNLI